MATTESQIDSIRELCTELGSDPRIKRAWVNDWGRFGNFEIFVTPEVHDRGASQRIRAAVKAKLPNAAHIRQMFGPDPIREWNRWTRKYVHRGYARTYWAVDIDFHPYDASTNRFADQLAIAPTPGASSNTSACV